MFRNLRILPLLSVCLLSFAAVAEDENATELRQFTFAWPFTDDSSMRPRGGLTKGPEVSLDPGPSAAWQDLQDSSISAQERDRRAILAMAGAYRASFDFLETIGFEADYTPQQPYQSWGTEFVYVVDDDPDFVSLQHIIVMFVTTPEGETMGPYVIKHWRQDWRYQDTDLHVYVGDSTWERRTLASDAVAGSWSQSVFQVDDSPRYAAIGRWQHQGGVSSWLSEQTWRPLPRREYSVRSDYDLLSGTNRHTITPTGWVHEEHNLKVALGDGESDGEPRVIAKEAGFNRYELITDHDFSAGDDYWQTTAPFWKDVRDAWEATFAARERFSLSSSYEDRSMFERMFEFAGNISKEEPYDAAAGQAFIAETLASYLN